VYVMDQQLSLPDGAAFHKSCFRCRHCSASLHPSNFSASPLDGALYCNPHFHLLFSHHNNKLQGEANDNSNSKANSTAIDTTSIPLISPSTAPSTKPLAAAAAAAAAAAPTSAPSAPAPAPAFVSFSAY
jgi:LIM domain